MLVIPINEHPIFGITKSALTHRQPGATPLFCVSDSNFPGAGQDIRRHLPNSTPLRRGETVAGQTQTMKLPMGEIPMDAVTFD